MSDPASYTEVGAVFIALSHARWVFFGAKAGTTFPFEAPSPASGNKLIARSFS